MITARLGRESVLLCRKLSLFADAFVAIDGSKFKAVYNRVRWVEYETDLMRFRVLYW